MNKKMIRMAIQESRIFKIGYSFLFAVQIPDDSVGISGSRCSYCDNKTAYCEQICRQCKLPLIGPFGFPQLPKWESLTPEKRKTMVEDIYCHKNDRGRLGYVNVEPVPLTKEELRKVEKLEHHDANLFHLTHDVTPQNISGILLTQ